MKYLLILSLITLAALASGSLSCFGCIKRITGIELQKSEEVLNKSLAVLAASHGPYYEAVKINSATRQVGIITKDEINAVLKDRQDNIKTCDLEIMSGHGKNDDISVTFYCPGEVKLVKSYRA